MNPGTAAGRHRPPRPAGVRAGLPAAQTMAALVFKCDTGGATLTLTSTGEGTGVFEFKAGDVNEGDPILKGGTFTMGERTGDMQNCHLLLHKGKRRNTHVDLNMAKMEFPWFYEEE